MDDTFFTLGSANVNVRSMENDSEINVASPAPEVTREWREDLWRMHTKVKLEKNMKDVSQNDSIRDINFTCY